MDHGPDVEATIDMFRTTRPPSVDVSAELRDLPTSHLTYHHEGAWFVLGPTGLFVITADEGNLQTAAELAVANAARLRGDLATELAWVPFVDALVATLSPDATLSLPCIAVPASLLRYTVSEGPRTVPGATLAQLTRLWLSVLSNQP
jgi:hypothetical protein